VGEKVSPHLGLVDRDHFISSQVSHAPYRSASLSSVGLTETAISDERGRIGRGMQSLLVGTR